MAFMSRGIFWVTDMVTNPREREDLPTDMAGTRLAAHSCFLVFALISVLIAWRLGVVKRAPLPLEKMANPSIGHKSSSDQRAAPLPLPVDIEVVLLRSSADDSCSSCTAVLSVIQANPSLVRIAFLDEAAATVQVVEATEESNVDATAQKKNGTEAAAGEKEELFSIRMVNLRVVQANPRLPEMEDAPSASKDPAALDDWLDQYFITSPEGAGTGPSSVHPVPTYTFFIGCGGGGERAGEPPTFVMGKRRHGYLALGCNFNCGRGGGDRGSGGGGGRNREISESKHATADPEGSGVLAGYESEVVVVAAVENMLRALAGLVVAHVLRTPIQARDMHVRLGQAYRLNFSLLSQDPAQRRCTWDFAAASRRYLRPMLKKLQPVASFAMQSQEVLYGRLVPAPPRKYSGMNRWYYSPFDLQSFLGANDFSMLDLAAGWGAEETAGGRKGSDPRNPTTVIPTPHSQVPVNFMVFCPAPKYNPLFFMEDWAGSGGRNRPAAEAFEVPGFGGVSVVNIDDAPAGQSLEIDALGPERLRRALGAHASQLRRIVGLPRPSDMPSKVNWPRLLTEELKAEILDGPSGGNGNSALGGSCAATSAGDKDGVLLLNFLPSPTDGVTDWEVDALLRSGLARNRAAAAQTLRSLAALVESQPEMEVSDKIAEDVVAALRALSEVDAAVSETLNGFPSEDARSPVTEEAATVPSSQGKGARGSGSDSVGNIGKRTSFSIEAQGEGGNGGSETAGSGTRTVSDWPGAGAMRWAREALRRSEAAYFDPTMVPQLYFPEDHLMAVYLPFLGPLAFPLLWGFVQELARYWKKRKAKRAVDEGHGNGASSGSGGDVR